jgi:hypothetical protein
MNNSSPGSNHPARIIIPTKSLHENTEEDNNNTIIKMRPLMNDDLDEFHQINMKTSNIIVNPILTDREYQSLNWSDEKFSYPGMVRIRTEADGSCFFHAIANAFFPAYREGKLNGKPISKHEMIRGLRRDLSLRLAQPVDPLNPDGPIHYDLLSRGQLHELSKDVPSYTLENMQKELDSDRPVNITYMEFISNQLNKDIYILNLNDRDVQLTADSEIFYKNRDSIVLLYMPGHYELVGVKQRDKIVTYFTPNHPFIQAIRRRMDYVSKRSS